jgi:glycosyltransferase involved in cell wall biosynthesis
MFMLFNLLRNQAPSLIHTLVGPAHKSEVEVSIILPVYNQAGLIQEVIRRATSCLGTKFELIIIDDASTDRTIDRILESSGELSEISNLVGARIFKNSFSRFETYCDNFGVTIATGRYCLEIQADMLVYDFHFDVRMIAALENNPDIAILSGRGVEPLLPIIDHYKSKLGTDRIETKSLFKHLLLRIRSHLKFVLTDVESKTFVAPPPELSTYDEGEYLHPLNEVFVKSGQAGRSGNELNSPLISSFPKNLIYIGETVMRGPLFFNLETFKEIGNFDVQRFFQGFDDHDFCARAMHRGYRVAYCPINFVSPLHFGSTRKRRSFSTELLIFINILRIRKSYLSSKLNSPVMLTLLSKSQNEIRNFSQ